MAPHRRGMCYELLVKTPGLSFPTATGGAAWFSQICKTVFGSSAPRPPITKAEVEDNICEFLTECDNHFHSLTICPIHDIFAPPCACPEKLVQYYNSIASTLEKTWARPIDPHHIRTIVETTLYARIKGINENNGIMNDIRGANSLILLNVHILVCIFAEFKHSHGYRPVDSLHWTVTGAIEQKQEAQERKETLLKQQEAKKVKSASGARNLSAADAAVAEERAP
ncbi:hypothetical protein FACUT_4258 [Fusarium acutatum]|uniref:Uncharacterized protein n=1 Tax=Fusarium acutatum TaxID=78861 RepID=A0A8H4NPD5_9HYPO|nr:hypothetical protein FACUT_4258 [Fusarium acutatum]